MRADNQPAAAPAGGWALPESRYAHRDSMITKSEVRALVVARLRPRLGRLIWDVGAGSGSVGIECALLGAAVLAVEQDPEACAATIQANAAAHAVRRPARCRTGPGGAGRSARTRTRSSSAAAASTSSPPWWPARPERVVLTLAALDRVAPAVGLLRAAGYTVEGSQLSAARLADLPGGSIRLAATNPVVVLTGERPCTDLNPPARIGLVAATAAGRRHADTLAAAWPHARLIEAETVADALRTAWAECDAVIAFLATGAVVRIVAPLLDDKRTDPAVVVVDEAARHAVALLGGHAGGANALAEAVAALLDARPVITTATDAVDLPGLDTLGWPVQGAVAAVSRAILDGEPVRLVADADWPLPALPPNVRAADEDTPDDGYRLLVTDRVVAPDERTAVLRPPSLVAGVGASRGVPAAEVRGAAAPGAGRGRPRARRACGAWPPPTSRPTRRAS